jgi:hypothetical protein
MQVLNRTPVPESMFHPHPTTSATAAATNPHFHLLLNWPNVFSINSDIPNPTPPGSELGEDENGKRGPQLSLPLPALGLEAVERRRPLFDSSAVEVD